MNNLFYTSPEYVTGDVLKLVDQEAAHASKVLRYRIGDLLFVTDGIGNRYESKITEITKREVTCTILSRKKEERTGPSITLMIGLIKKRDRLEFAAEKATELGADKIIIYRGDHSEKGNTRMDRIEATVLSAMKQSLRNYLPEVQFSESLSDGLSTLKSEDAIIFADETEIEDEAPGGNEKSISLIVGPEGGFSQKEREVMIERGGVPYSLGNKRLRTETAAITITDRYKNSLQ